jgi:hypothetical protein
LEEKLGRIGHGLEINGGKVKQQVSDGKKQYEHLKQSEKYNKKKMCRVIARKLSMNILKIQSLYG